MSEHQAPTKQKSLRLDHAIHERAEDLIDHVGKIIGATATPADVMRMAISRGLDVLAEERDKGRSRRRKRPSRRA